MVCCNSPFRLSKHQREKKKNKPRNHPSPATYRDILSRTITQISEHNEEDIDNPVEKNINAIAEAIALETSREV